MAGEPDRPNLLVVMVDCLRSDHFHGQQPAPLPNAARARSLGTSWTSYFANATTTAPCTATIFTGQHPFHHGVRAQLGYRLNRESKTLAQRLGAAGYLTCAETCGPLGREADLDRGFERFDRRQPADNVFGRFGQQWLAKLGELQRAGRPWFLFLHVWALHMPLPAPLGDRLAYRFPAGPLLAILQYVDLDILVPLWKLYRRAWGRVEGGAEGHGTPGGSVVPRPSARIGRKLIDIYKRTAYERALAALDRDVLGPLLDAIDLGDTVLAILGDHGEYLDSADQIGGGISLRGRPAHGFHVYDYLTRVPLVLAGGTRVPAGRVDDTPSSHVDALPTLLAALGMPASEDSIDGVDLLGASQEQARPIFLEAVGGGRFDQQRYLRGVRHRGWKLVTAPFVPTFEEELYWLDRDPGERDNRRRRDEPKADQLRQLLDEHFAGDPIGREPPGSGGESWMSGSDRRAVEERLRRLGYLE